MTSVTTGLNSYAQYGAAYARSAGTQTSLASVLNATSDDVLPGASNAATQLTLSAAARAQLASGAKDFATVISDSRAAIDKLYEAANVTAPYDADGKPTIVPAGIANDPVAAYLAQYPSGSSTATADFSSVAKAARAALDDQAKQATAAGKLLVYDQARKTGQLADLSSLDNRSLSAISLNQDQQFSQEEISAAKRELDSRNRASILAALKQSQTSGNPADFSLGLLNAYSGMSAEERTATNWTPAFRDQAVQSYKATTSLLSMLKGG